MKRKRLDSLGNRKKPTPLKRLTKFSGAVLLGMTMTAGAAKDAIAETWSCGNDIDSMVSGTDFTGQGAIKGFAGVPGGNALVSVWDSTNSKYVVYSTSDGVTFTDESSTLDSSVTNISDGDLYVSGMDISSGYFSLSEDTDQNGGTDASYVGNSSLSLTEMIEAGAYGSANSSGDAYLGVYVDSSYLLDIYLVDASSSSSYISVSGQTLATPVVDEANNRAFVYSAGSTTGLVRVTTSGSQTTLVSSSVVPMQDLSADDSPNAYDTVIYADSSGNLYYCEDTDSSASPLDEDGDGYDTDSDCDDTDASINPGATEVCDGVDNNCDGTTDTDASDRIMVYTDSDQDGVGAGAGELACEADDFQSEIDGDCDDDNASAYNWETGYVDADGDGYGAGEASDYCPMPEGVVANADDCNDEDSSYWEGDQCTPTEEGASSGEFSASEEEVVLSSGATLTVVEGTVSLETNDDEHVLTLNEGSHAWLSTVAIPTIIQMEMESNNDARTYVYESARVELVAGISDGANMMAGGGNSGSGSYYISGTTYGNSETQDSDEYSENNYDTGLDLDVDSTYYEANSDEENELNVCYEDEGNWYQVNHVDGPEEESYLCVRVESGRVDAYGAEIQRFTLDSDVMYEFYDGYTCPEGSGEQEPEDEEPDNQNPTNNNPDGTPRGNNPKGCSTSGMTPTGTLAVMAGFLALAAGRRRKETTA